MLALYEAHITHIMLIQEKYPSFSAVDMNFKEGGIAFEIDDDPYEIFISNEEIKNAVKNENSYSLKTESQGELEFFFYKLFV